MCLIADVSRQQHAQIEKPVATIPHAKVSIAGLDIAGFSKYNAAGVVDGVADAYIVVYLSLSIVDIIGASSSVGGGIIIGYGCQRLAFVIDD